MSYMEKGAVLASAMIRLRSRQAVSRGGKWMEFERVPPSHSIINRLVAGRAGASGRPAEPVQPPSPLPRDHR